MGNEESHIERKNQIERADITIPNYLPEAESISLLQKEIINISNSNFESCKSLLRHKITEQEIKSLVRFIMTALSCRIDSAPLLADLILCLFQNELADKLKHEILQYLHKIPFLYTDPIIEWYHFPLYFYLLKNSFILSQEITQEICSIYEKSSERNSLLSTLFCFFGKQIEESDASFFSELHHYYKESLNSTTFPQTLAHHFENLGSYRANNWNLLEETIEQRYENDSIEWILKNDELEKFKTYSSAGNFDYNKRIEPYIFAQCPIVQHSPTLVQFSAFFGSINCLRYLVEKGADLNLNDEASPEISIAQFAVAGGHKETIDYIQDLKISFQATYQVAAKFYRNDYFSKITYEEINLRDDTFGTPFLYATAANNVGAMLYCFDNGAFIHITDHRKRTALHFAAINDSYEAAHLLLYQPDVEAFAKDRDEMTPAHYACERGSLSVLKSISSRPGFDPNMKNLGFMTLLHLAAIKGHINIIEHLLTFRNLDINFQASNKNTALHFAAQNGHADVIKILLNSLNINANALNRNDDTPIHLAAQKGYINVVKAFLKVPKLNINQQNSQGVYFIFIKLLFISLWNS